MDINTGDDDSAPQAGSYAGTTSQGLPIGFSVTPEGDVVDIQFGWRARCEDGLVHVNSIVLPGAPMKDGSFAVGGPLETGGLAHVDGTFDGPQAEGALSRSRGTAFGVNCTATDIEWTAEPGAPPAMPRPSTGAGGGDVA